MKKQYQRSLFIFRRDLRIKDNSGLLHAAQLSKEIVPCFIFDPQQISTHNAYRSLNALQCMRQSIVELEHEIKVAGGTLLLGYDDPIKWIDSCIKTGLIDAVFCNYDYTPFSLKRDERILHLCAAHHIPFIQTHDALLTKPDDVKTGNGTPYSIFTPFFNQAKKRLVAEPVTHKSFHFFTATLPHVNIKTVEQIPFLKEKNKNIWVSGGRKEAINLLKKLPSLYEYHTTKDLPSLETSNLSAHLKFGTISIREAFWEITNQLGHNHDLIRQLYWRDFFTHIAYHSPFIFGGCYQQKYNALPWAHGKQADEHFLRWCQGETGFPIVDAGMRQLAETGFMHNRVRMITASFLIKDLHIDWRKGEQFFAQHLVDYDPAVNNGNWQWCASTGCDAQPYFRIFNPWLQQKKYDAEGVYIKKWVPELKKVPTKTMHRLFDTKQQVAHYPSPMINHDSERTKTLAYFRL